MAEALLLQVWSLLLGVEVGKAQWGIRVVAADQRADWDFEAGHDGP
jgi:hypothetical protein